MTRLALWIWNVTSTASSSLSLPPSSFCTCRRDFKKMFKFISSGAMKVTLSHLNSISVKGNLKCTIILTSRFLHACQQKHRPFVCGCVKCQNFNYISQSTKLCAWLRQINIPMKCVIKSCQSQTFKMCCQSNFLGISWCSDTVSLWNVKLFIKVTKVILLFPTIWLQWLIGVKYIIAWFHTF